MKLAKTINLLEWLLFVIIFYYFFLVIGIIAISLGEGNQVSDVIKVVIFLVVVLLSVISAKTISNTAARYVHKISSIQMIIVYIISMAGLSAILPFYLQSLLSIFDILPS